MKLDWEIEWEKIIYSDSKRFNIDGPYMFFYYLHDLRKKEMILSKRHTGVVGVMLWAAFSPFAL